MTELSLSLEAKAHYAAQILAERNCRKCNCWRVRVVKERVYGKSLLTQIAEMRQREQPATDETITQTIEIDVRSDVIIFTTEEAYLIARSLINP